MNFPSAPVPPRRHFGPNGLAYTVEVAPIEAPAGGTVGGWVAILFTREADGAVLSVEVPAGTDPRWLTGSELDDLLTRAR